MIDEKAAQHRPHGADARPHRRPHSDVAPARFAGKGFAQDREAAALLPPKTLTALAAMGAD